ncbi:MAG: hypothetical protein KME18_07940 [Phormidium tanganyikae FI6-MK23]|jgi:opacity protein-like surface antigen|nr:hypothetical protein [Phormidium tanganyikae FI6-MK23]
MARFLASLCGVGAALLCASAAQAADYEIDYQTVGLTQTFLLEQGQTIYQGSRAAPPKQMIATALKNYCTARQGEATYNELRLAVATTIFPLSAESRPDLDNYFALIALVANLKVCPPR